MAARAKRLDSNSPGDFYVDATCIDCGTCRWLAPASFDAEGERSRVYRQPARGGDVAQARLALLACPVSAIGTETKHDLREARAAFPRPIENGVHHCGYHARSSFGAASYLIVRPGGNILVDSPRFAGPLVKRLEALGGVRTMFLTHRDDVADHARFRAHFGCERILHADDIGPGTEGIERPIEGRDPVRLDDELLILPVPGHTRGSACLLYREKFLFSGDHVAWSPALGHLYAFRRACWHDWHELRRSMARLAGYDFEHVLPGHGWPCRFPRGQMRAEMAKCLEWTARN